MHQGLGWAFIIVGGIIVLAEVAIYVVKTFRLPPKEPKPGRTEIPKDVVIELIKKLPWMVILGLILIYLGLYIIGAPVPFSITIGN